MRAAALFADKEFNHPASMPQAMSLGESCLVGTESLFRLRQAQPERVFDFCGRQPSNPFALSRSKGGAPRPTWSPNPAHLPFANLDISVQSPFISAVFFFRLQ